MNPLFRFLALGLGLAAAAAAGDPPSGAPSAAPAKPAAAPADQQPAPVVTEHTIVLDGKTIKYRAYAGYLHLTDDGAPPPPAGKGPDAGPAADEPKPNARIFYVAYVREGVADPSSRPLTFAFNGGPGAASIWLHVGALGPREPELTERGEAPPPPYRIVDNPNSWIDATDLVFIDPMSTGYSRPLNGARAQSFYGLQPDIASVADFIRLYTTRAGRWTSPKFLCGESYGTTRAAGLSEYLEDHCGIYVNGIVLMGSALNFEAFSFNPGNDRPYPLYLPTYATTAWYHRCLSPELEALPVAKIAAMAEDFAEREYAPALMAGSSLPPSDEARIAAGLSRLTGLPAAKWEQWNLRLAAPEFFVQLLMDRNRVIGRFDSRFTGPRIHPGTDDWEYDPSFDAVNPTFVAVFNDYVRRELHYKSDLPYEALTSLQPWSTPDNAYVDTAADLREAMTRNPYLKVMVCCGYYDLATPFFSAQTVLNELELAPSLRGNVTIHYYDSGHMLYINRPSQAQFKRDFEAFLKSAILPPDAAVPTAAP